MLQLYYKQMGFGESFKGQRVLIRQIIWQADSLIGVKDLLGRTQKRFQSSLPAKVKQGMIDRTSSQFLHPSRSKETLTNQTEAQPLPQTTSKVQLFHISSLATRFGESYNNVAYHINSVFSGGPAQEVQPQVNVERLASTRRCMRHRSGRKSLKIHKRSTSEQIQLKDDAREVVDSGPTKSKVSSTWEEGYLHFARHINSYFGAKVTDEDDELMLKSGQRDTDLTPTYKMNGQSSSEKCALRLNSTFSYMEEAQASRTKSGLFHISNLATSFGECYAHMASHVNQYFQGKVSLEEDNEELEQVESNNQTSAGYIYDTAQQQPVSFIECLRQPSTAIPDLFGRYLGMGLKRQTPKQIPGALPAEGVLTRRVVNKRQAEEKTQVLVERLKKAADLTSLTTCIEDLNRHIIQHPACRAVVWQEKAVPTLLGRRRCEDSQKLQGAIREALALIGYADPVKGQGIRVLSIDGGGTRGVVPLQVLKQLEAVTGKQVYQLFDYIGGVSTGAVVAFLLGLARISLEECEELYRRFGSDVFQQNPLVGTMKMGLTHSYYNTATWERILRDRMGDDLLIQTARDKSSPKVSAVSAVVNWGTSPKAFIFRNYNHAPGRVSRYAGGSGYQLWQAVRASSAAPGYFQEFPLHGDIHQDGGLILNNPCALAVHECRLLWPAQPFQCVLSLGTGRYDNTKRGLGTSTSLRAKISNLISSATDTEGVHTLLDDLLSDNVYFRFNPMLSADVSLDESRPYALEQLRADTQLYLDRNRHKMERLFHVLGTERTVLQHARDWVGERAWVLQQRWV